MRTIWKFPLPLHCETAPVCVLMVPPSFKPLSVDLQRGVPVIWAEVDVPAWAISDTVTDTVTDPVMPSGESRLLARRLRVTRCGTGRQMPSDPGSYLGTYQCLDQTCNKHVYLKWEDGTPVVRA